MKIVKKKVKKQKLNGDVSKSGSGDKTSVSKLYVNQQIFVIYYYLLMFYIFSIQPRKIENNLLDSRGEPFIKLLCPHCEVTCKTFRVSRHFTI